MAEQIPVRSRGKRTGRPSKSRTRALKAATQLADEKALDLRVQGKTIRDIARETKCSTSTAHARIERALAVHWRAGAEKAEQVRAIEVERLDKLLAAYWDAATTGDADAAAVVLKVCDRRAKLFGLDKPQEHRLEVVDVRKLSDAELEVVAAGGRVAALPAPPVVEVLGEVVEAAWSTAPQVEAHAEE